jgi:hypothetical protein
MVAVEYLDEEIVGKVIIWGVVGIVLLTFCFVALAFLPKIPLYESHWHQPLTESLNKWTPSFDERVAMTVRDYVAGEIQRLRSSVSELIPSIQARNQWMADVARHFDT